MECKSGFDFSSVSSHSKVVNANRLQVHALAYNLLNWFRQLALTASMRKQRIETIRLKLLKIAAKAVRSARYTVFKLHDDTSRLALEGGCGSSVR